MGHRDGFDFSCEGASEFTRAGANPSLSSQRASQGCQQGFLGAPCLSGQQLVRIDLERFGQPTHDDDRWISHVALYTADIGSVKPGSERQLLHRLGGPFNRARFGATLRP
jgi:hypothetical protein